MGKLRARIERDLSRTLEGDFGLPVVLIAPDGTKQVNSANDATSLLYGRVDYDRVEQDPATGLPIIVKKPMITLRLSSLDRVPQAGENWGIQIPILPDENAAKVTFFMEQAPRDGGSIGYIKIPLTPLEQV